MHVTLGLRKRMKTGGRVRSLRPAAATSEFGDILDYRRSCLKKEKGKKCKKLYASLALIPALRRQRHVYLCEFKASLVYRASSRRAKATERNFVSKNNNKTTTKSYTQIST